MQERLFQYINTHQLIHKSDKLAIAVSGGMDSMCAVALFTDLEMPFHVLHCNFQLRGKDSDLDEELVKRLASNKYCLGVHTERFETRIYAKEQQLSIQEAARELRYAYFASAHAKGLFTKLITAHHKNDQLETLFINLQRGTGIRGLAGMPIQREFIIRPLMCFDRSEIESHVNDKKIAFREDLSNQSDAYLRNRIRHDLLPVIEDRFPNFKKQVYQSMQRIRAEGDLFYFMASNARKKLLRPSSYGSYSIDILQLLTYPHSDLFLYHLLDGTGLNRVQCQDILQTKQVGKRVASASHELLRDRSALILHPIVIPDAAVTIAGPGTYEFGQGVFILDDVYSQVFSDDPYEELVQITSDLQPIQLRYWEEGDFIQPLGMTGKKLISDLFADLKLNGFEKQRTPLLTSGKEVLWVIGQRLSERIKVQSKARVLCVRFSPKP